MPVFISEDGRYAGELDPIIYGHLRARLIFFTGSDLGLGSGLGSGLVSGLVSVVAVLVWAGVSVVVGVAAGVE